MKIGIACGGTGGHIFPGLATAEALRRRGHEVVLWLAGKSVEQSAVAGWDGPAVTVPFGGFRGLRSWRAPLVVLELLRAVRRCRRALRANRPDVLLAMGSYASLAPVWAARSLGVPVVLHEANAVPGRAIRFLARRAAAVAVAFDETRAHLEHPRLVVTGMPLRKSGQRSEIRDQGEEGRDQQLAIRNSPLRFLNPQRFTLLVMGGSGGAHSLNEKATGAVIRLHRAGQALQVIHLTGLADEEAVRRRYEEAGVVHAVFGFSHAMPEIYRRASLAVCRAGSSTCAELCRYGVAALLVPYPFATGQHQLANARALAAAGAAEVREEAELTADGLADYVAGAMAAPERLERLRRAARARERGDAAEALADLVERVGGGKVLEEEKHLPANHPARCGAGANGRE